MPNKKSPLTIKEITNALKNKECSVTDLVTDHIHTIETKNDTLNAFLTITKEKALREAKAFDRELVDNPSVHETKPLFGIPVAYKDLYLTKGVKTTASSKVLENYIPQYSATVVEKYETSGAISLGKLNCDAWAHGSSGENSDFGPAKNPHNLDYVPGGSSSGSAVAVASGMVPLATGTDTGGSIRLPANFCGVVGLKPTYGRVSRYGIIAMSSSLDSIGHFTHTVEDAATVLSVTSGQDPQDANTANSKPFSTNLNQSVKSLKIGIPKEYVDPITNPVVKENFAKTVSILERMGMELVELSLPHTPYAGAVYYILQPSEVSSNLARFDGIRYGNKRSQFGAEAMRRMMIGSFTLSSGYYDAYYRTALKVRTLIASDFETAFANVDAIITPVSPTPPFKLGSKTSDPIEMYLSDIFTITANLAGIPGIALPSGYSKELLPLGVQLLGPRWSEEILFPIAHQLETAIGFNSL